jgi:small subunit ribosomal protein S13
VPVGPGGGFARVGRTQQDERRRNEIRAPRGVWSRRMPRILGVDIPPNKQLPFALPYIYGVGRVIARKVCEGLNLDPTRLAKSLTDEEISRINNYIEKNYVVEGNLRRQRTQNVNRLRDIKCYRGMRHRANLPVRGQRTRTNARTRKGPRKTIAGKKLATKK